MFIFRLLILPIRGLWLTIWGIFTSLPIWIILGVIYLNVWTPRAVEFITKKVSGFHCSSISTDIRLTKGQFILKDICINNPIQYPTSDFIRINKIEVQSSVAQYFKAYQIYNKIELDVGNITWVWNASEDDNIRAFIESFLSKKITEKASSEEANNALNSVQKETTGKPFFIKNLTIRFNGTVSIQDYSSVVSRTRNYPVTYEKTFNNVTHKLNDGQKMAIGETVYISYEDAIMEILKTFREGYGFTFLVNSILTSLNKYPSLSPFLQKFL